MKEILIKIREEDSYLITQLLEKLGAEVFEQNLPAEKKGMKKKTVNKKEQKQEKVSPTFLFGKWKGLDIDAKQLRKESWDRSHKSL